VNDLSPLLAGELARAGFAGMKDSTGDVHRYRAYLEAVHGVESFELYTGTELQIVEAVRAGGSGSINALSSCRPELFAALRDALEAGDGVEELHAEVAALKAQVKAEGSTVQGVKRRVRKRLAERGVDYPAATRPPFV
jgi:dihydrodipicolinate synthase/N-acetylneuraminate lyase